MIEKLTRKQIRYLMFRFKNEAMQDGESIRGAEAKKLLEGWGHKATQTQANGLIGDIKDAYESQDAFGGWQNFNGPSGVASSWDIGLYDPAASDAANVSLMLNRADKWFLFGIDKAICVNTRAFSGSVSEGLDYFKGSKFKGKKLVLTETKVKERRLRMGIQGDGRRRDAMFYENDGRDFEYDNIIKFAIDNEVSQWH